MTYIELSQIKTASMTMNGILDDIINNARFCYTKAAFKKASVSEYQVEGASIDSYRAIAIDLACQRNLLRSELQYLLDSMNCVCQMNEIMNPLGESIECRFCRINAAIAKTK